MALPPYEYSGLPTPDSIRLVSLQPASFFDAPLHCDIVTVRRPELLTHFGETKHYYEAVSYSWGEPILTKRLLPLYLKRQA